MTLLETIRLIERVASAQPDVNMIVKNDVFRLNAASDARYGVFAWTQGQHEGSVYGPTHTFAFTLFYVDRLTASQGNQEEIQSVGVETLENILRTLEEQGVEVGTWTMQTFNQRFLDECAGVFCNVRLQVPIVGVCGEAFGDFNDDFNDDFLIF
jgi:hypothetical protein